MNTSSTSQVSIALIDQTLYAAKRRADILHVFAEVALERCPDSNRDRLDHLMSLRCLLESLEAIPQLTGIKPFPASHYYIDRSMTRRDQLDKALAEIFKLLQSISGPLESMNDKFINTSRRPAGLYVAIDWESWYDSFLDVYNNIDCHLPETFSWP